METMLTIKFLMFLALELLVVGVMGAVLIVGLYEIVPHKIRELRRVDEVALGSPPASSTGSVDITREPDDR